MIFRVYMIQNSIRESKGRQLIPITDLSSNTISRLIKKHSCFSVCLASSLGYDHSGDKEYLMSFISFLFVDSVRSLGRKQCHVVPVCLSNKHRLSWVQSQTGASVTLLKVILKKKFCCMKQMFCSNELTFDIFKRP